MRTLQRPKTRKDITLPKEIIVEINQRSSNISKFVTEALEFYLEHLKREEFKMQMKSYFEANETYQEEISNDFDTISLEAFEDQER